MKARYLIAAGAAALAFGSVANATVMVRVTDTYFNGTTTVTSTPIDTDAMSGGGGSVTQNASDGFFTFTVSASGAPSNPDPNFSSINFNVQQTNANSPLAAAHTLVIEFTNFNLTSSGTTYTVTNTLNTLQATALSSPATLVTSLGVNTPYSTSFGLLSSLSCSAGQLSCANAQTATLAHGTGSYSEDVKYTFVFGAGSANQSVSGTNVIMPAAAVPETATWAMMVLGFGAVGAALRTSRRKVVFA